MPGMWFGSRSDPAVIAAHPPDLPRIRPLESRMLGNLHVRFGGGLRHEAADVSVMTGFSTRTQPSVRPLVPYPDVRPE